MSEKSFWEKAGDVLDMLNDPLDQGGERKAARAAKEESHAKGSPERARVLAFMRAPEHAAWTAAQFIAAIERGDHAK